MAKLTKHFIDTEIEYPSKGYRIYRDDELPGLAVRVTKDLNPTFLKKPSMESTAASSLESAVRLP